MKIGDFVNVASSYGVPAKKAIIEKKVTRTLNGRKVKGFKVRYENGATEEVQGALCSKRHDNPTGVLLASLTGSQSDAGKEVYYQKRKPSKGAILTHAGLTEGSLPSGYHVEWDFSLRQYVKRKGNGKKTKLGTPQKGKDGAFKAALRSLKVSAAQAKTSEKALKEGQLYDLTEKELSQIYAVAPELKSGSSKAAPKKASNIKSIRSAIEYMQDLVGQVSDAKFKQGMDLIDQAVSLGAEVSIEDLESIFAKKASTKKASTKKASTKKASTKKASTKKASTKKAEASQAALGQEVAKLAQSPTTPPEAVDAAAAAGGAAVKAGASPKVVKQVAKAAAKNAKQEVAQQSAAEMSFEEKMAALERMASAALANL